MKTKRTVFEVNDVYRVMENSELKVLRFYPAIMFIK